MIGLSIGAVAACVLIVYVGAAVQASLGIGLGMISSAVLALVDTDFIPVAIVLSVIPLSGSVAFADRAHIDRRGLGWTLGGRIPGVVLGAIVAASLSDRLLSLLVAGTVLVSVAASITTSRFEPRDGALVAAGLTSGFMGTATGVGGPPIALVYQHSDPATMRSTISAFFALGAVMSMLALTVAGEVGRRQLELSLMLLPSIVIGVVTARLVRHRLRAAVVRPAVLVLCSASAGALLVETFV
ncbi:MAG: sulfite exporter TauE/SafE family protein [Ilumatobacter sp.]|nr:sulfite exporter TauE/SafE family protein [Ilumatobacter sp.]